MNRFALRPPVSQEGPLGELERLAALARYEAGEWVYRSADPIENWYRVVRGAARTSALSGDGRRHVVEFLLPGDVFGFSAVGDRHFFGVEALVSRTLITRYPRRGAERLADSDPHLARNLREFAFRSIDRLHRRLAFLGRSSARERVSAFLLEMADRGHAAPTREVPLPMSRYDIADYLGLAVETVSRTLTQLRAHHVIAFRDVRLLLISDRRLLEELAEGPIGVGAQSAVPWIRPPRPGESTRPLN